MSQKKICSAQGFTLVEILVALFIFVILMVGVSQIFGAAFFGYRNTRAVQKDLENAQFTLNSMVKMLRTSTVVSPAASNTNRVRFYDYSQGLCIEYWIDGGNKTLSVISASTSDSDQCKLANFPAGSFAPLTSGNVSGTFVLTPSDGTSSPKVVGKVTVSLQIQEAQTHAARIQSSVSLRDYGNVGW